MADLDHRFVSPPFIRVCDRFKSAGSDEICVWHLRIAQPNVSNIAMPIMHSLEHFLGDYMREACDAVITVAPMGCQTGFYIVATIAEFDRMERLLAEVLQAITSAESVPHADVIHCGWAASHTVDGARTVAAWLLTHRAEWADVGPSAIEV